MVVLNSHWCSCSCFEPSVFSCLATSWSGPQVSCSAAGKDRQVLLTPKSCSIPMSSLFMKFFYFSDAGGCGSGCCSVCYCRASCTKQGSPRCFSCTCNRFTGDSSPWTRLIDLSGSCTFSFISLQCVTMCICICMFFSQIDIYDNALENLAIVTFLW